VKAGAAISVASEKGIFVILTVKVVNVKSLKGIGIHFVRQRILLEGKQVPVIPNDIGICRRSICPTKFLIVRPSVTIPSKHSLSSRTFSPESFCAYPSILEVDMAVFNAKCANCSVAMEVDFLRSTRDMGELTFSNLGTTCGSGPTR